MPGRYAALLLLALAAVASLAWVRSQPPAAKPKAASPTEFSAARAYEELRDLVGDGVPHPPGTKEHELLREKIASKLGELGLDVEQGTSFVCGPRTCASVTHLFARVPGLVGAKAVLLSAHYDSVPAGPGASDDGMGVATLLEAARAIKASAPLRRPVWLLLTDGEELGLLGAKAFAKNKALLDQVGAVVNVEARGTTGPSLMFETSPDNRGLIANFATSTEHPVASSLFPTLYALLPNDTDLSVYKALGIPGLNYAVIGGAARYHTPRDDIDHVDVRSLQHHGDNVLAVVRSLASGRESASGAGDLVFFDVLGTFVVRWPERTGPWIAIALLGCMALATVTAFRRGALLLGEYTRGLAGLLAPGSALGLAWAAELGLRALGAAPAPWIAEPAPLIVVSGGLGALASVAIVRGVAHKAGPAGVFWGATTVFSLVGAALSVTYPGLSFLFLAPAVGGAMGCWGWALGGDRTPGRTTLFWAALMPAFAVVVWTPPLGMLYDGLGTSVLPAMALGTGLLVWTAGVMITVLRPRVRFVLSGVLAIATLVAAAGSLAVAPHTTDIPAHASFRTYVAEDGNTKTTLATDERVPAALIELLPDREPPWPWSSERAPAILSRGDGGAPLPLPSLETATSTSLGGGRHIVATLRSSRGAAIVGIAIAASAGLSDVRMRGEALGVDARAQTAWRSFECVTTPPEGVEISLTLQAEGPIEAYVYDRTPGIAMKSLLSARPVEVVPMQSGDVTVAGRRVKL